MRNFKEMRKFERDAIVHFIRHNDMRRKEDRKSLEELKALLPKDLLQALLLGKRPKKIERLNG